ncbi:MAG: efflux RND transporter periplasmic adaptor subunit [Chitinophagales bacterium]|jgi:membrane fusion protein (multidrug efflux system)|nr:efflux RND transporter periplasmic adaptor subunit [Chitinophagales bacterium]
MYQIFFVTLIGVSVLLGCHPKKHQEASQTFKVSTPYFTDTTYNQEFVCQIRAIQHIELRALEKGYLQKIYVDEGQFVRKGQLLFQIKPNIYQAEAQISSSELEFAKIEYENNKALLQKNIVSKSEVALSEAKLAKAKAELSLAKTHLGFTEIRAPFDGIIGKFEEVRVGSLLDEGELLTTLSDNRKMWVYFNVPETQYLDYMKLKSKNLAQKVQLKLANDELFSETGSIETIESDFSNTSGNIAFRAVFDNPQLLLRYGQTGTILWPKPIQNAMIIPQKSTFEILDKKFVYVVNKDGVLETREIVVDTELPHIFILKSGLSITDKYLLEGQKKVSKGDKINYKLISPSAVMADLDLYAN